MWQYIYIVGMKGFTPEIIRTDKDIEISMLIDAHFCLRDDNDWCKNRQISRLLSFRNLSADGNDDLFDLLICFYFGTSIRNFIIKFWWGQLAKF